MIDQSRQNSDERLEVMFKTLSGGVFTNVIPDSCTLLLQNLDSNEILASGLEVNIAQPCYYDLVPALTATLGQYVAKWSAVIGNQELEHHQYYEVVTRKTKYANVKDVDERTREMQLPNGLDITRYIIAAEQDIDLYLAEVYAMPIDLKSTEISNRDKQTIEDLAADIATGRMISGLALAGGERNEVAVDLEKKAWKKLMDIKDGKVELESVSKRSTATRKDLPKVDSHHPDYIDNPTDDTSFFGNTDRIGSSNIWKS